MNLEMAYQQGAKDDESWICPSEPDIPYSPLRDLPASSVKHGAGKQLSSMVPGGSSEDIPKCPLSREFVERDGEETSQETDTDETYSDNSSDHD